MENRITTLYKSNQKKLLEDFGQLLTIKTYNFSAN